MFAIIKTGGKQYRVKQDDVIRVEKLAGESGTEVVFDEVLLAGDGENTEVGDPRLDRTTVTGTILEQLRARKIIVFKKKRRKNYRRLAGHRQEITCVKINEIKTGAASKNRDAERSKKPKADPKADKSAKTESTKQVKSKTAIKSETAAEPKLTEAKEPKTKSPRVKKSAKTKTSSSVSEKTKKKTKEGSPDNESPEVLGKPSKTDTKEIE